MPAERPPPAWPPGRIAVPSDASCLPTKGEISLLLPLPLLLLPLPLLLLSLCTPTFLLLMLLAAVGGSAAERNASTLAP